MSREVRPAVPDRLRPVAVGLAVAAGLVLVVSGLLHHGSSGPDAFDRPVRAAISARWPHPGPGFYVVDGLVSLVPIPVTLGLLAVVALLTRLRRVAVLAVLGPFGVAGTITVLKPLVDRTIHGDNLSFPSGHTGYATAVGVVVGLILVGLVRPARTAWATVLLLAPVVLAGAGMALDQVAIDAHYPSDTVAGSCTAVAVILVMSLLFDFLIDRWAV